MIRKYFQICNTNSIKIHILSLDHNGFSFVYTLYLATPSILFSVLQKKFKELFKQTMTS